MLEEIARMLGWMSVVSFLTIVLGFVSRFIDVLLVCLPVCQFEPEESNTNHK